MGDQAEVAREYRALDAERETKQHMLWLVRRDEALAEQARIARLVAEAVNQIEAQRSAQRSVEAQLEALRAAHYQTSDDVHRAQGTYYEAQTEVARLEGEIRFVTDSQAQLRERLAALALAADAARDRELQARDALDRNQESQAVAQERQEAFAARLEEAGAGLPMLEDRLADAREALERARTQAAETAQQLQVVATRQRGHEDALRDLGVREDRLRDARMQAQAAPVAELEALQQRLAEAEAIEEEAGERFAQTETRWSELDAMRAPAQEALREAQSRLSQVDARINALRQIQERTRTGAATAPWLLRHGLDQLRRLWQRLRIEPGWESAIESVLRERVQALEVGRIESLSGLLDERPPA